MYPQNNDNSGSLVANKKLIALSALAAVFIVLLLVWLFGRASLRIVSISPSTSSINILTPYVDVSYNKSLSGYSVDASGTRSLVYGVLVNGSVVRVVLKTPLLSGSNYAITVNIKNGSKSISNSTFSFKPVYATWSQLTQTQKNFILKNQSGKTSPSTDLSILPYIGPDYELTVSNSTPQPSIEFTYVPSTWDTYQGQSAETAAINSAKQWLTQHNISLNPVQLIDSSSGQPL